MWAVGERIPHLILKDLPERQVANGTLFGGHDLKPPQNSVWNSTVLPRFNAPHGTKWNLKLLLNLSIWPNCILLMNCRKLTLVCDTLHPRTLVEAKAKPLLCHVFRTQRPQHSHVKKINLIWAHNIKRQTIWGGKSSDKNESTSTVKRICSVSTQNEKRLWTWIESKSLENVRKELNPQENSRTL